MCVYYTSFSVTSSFTCNCHVPLSLFPCTGGVYVEDAIFKSTEAVAFINNSAGIAGGAIIGSPLSLVRIMGQLAVFQDNVAAKVCLCWLDVRTVIDLAMTHLSLHMLDSYAEVGVHVPDMYMAQGNHAMLYGNIVLLAEETPLTFDTCNAFILSPEKECDSPPRSNTVVTEYVSGDDAMCSWTQPGSRPPFECRCHADARLDADTGNCVCNLGYFGDGRRFCHEMGAPKWLEMTLMSKTPSARVGHSMTLAKDFFWLFGGRGSDGEYMGDLYCMCTQTYIWKSHGVAASSGGPSPRAHHAVATWKSYVFIHGGSDNTTKFNDLFMFEAGASPPLWTELSNLRDAPSPRCHHVAAVVTKPDGSSALLYIFGGMSMDGTLLGDLYELDVSALRWKSLGSAAATPSPRKLHTLVLNPFLCFSLCVYPKLN